MAGKSKDQQPQNWRNRIVGYDNVAPDQLLANPNNWRVHPRYQQEALQGALNEVGWVDDVIVNRVTGHVVDGHLRVALALRNDEPAVPVKYVELTEEEEKLVLATLDPITAMATTDTEKLDALLHEVSTGEQALQDALAQIAQQAGLYLDEMKSAEDPGPQIDRAKELQEKWGTETGQLWRIPSKATDGEHRIICGDCTVPAVVERVMMGEKADLVFSDPPYGANFDPTKNRGNPVGGIHSNGKFVSSISRPKVIGDESPEIAIQAWKIWRNHAPIQIWWGANYYANYLPASSCWFVWDKENTGDFADVELAWCNQNRAARLFRHMWNGMMKSSEHGERRFHATQKPVALAVWCLEKFPNAIIVADPFLGSGISLLACERLGRLGRGVEIAPEYVAVALERLAGMGLEPELVDTLTL
ncbi:MAG: hypothetical protein D6706_18725 [Chloroflexi bacterium]|nr:MAG: hypothetical protein D6706_18725 [Chloroflexota bacterium]